MTARTLRYLFAALGMGMIFLTCCGRADARSPFLRPRPAPPPYSFSIEDEQGNSLSTFVKEGHTFVLGEPGLRYDIRIRNPTNQRVEAVVSVDGRDAVSGQPGDYVSQRGYVIPAYGSLLVEGFRRSLEEVAAFRFTSPEDSYSSRLGTPQNVGIVGVAFFPERMRPAQPVIRRQRALPRRAGATRDDEGDSLNHLGTQFGESRESIVNSVSFERASATHPALLCTVRYDDAQGLQARGIDVYGDAYERVDADEPQAFPVSRFAQPPP